MKTSDVPDTGDNENWQKLGDVTARILARLEKAIGEIEEVLQGEENDTAA